MKKVNKKKCSKKKIFKGFTLVELLAVIVILAIIMIIAIPSVLNTLQTARKKTMVEFAQKVYNKVEEKYLERQMMGQPYNLDSEESYILFDIRKDLGFSSVGDYYGVAFYKVDNLKDDYDDEYNTYISLSIFNEEYYLEYDGYKSIKDPNKKEITVDNIMKISDNQSYQIMKMFNLDYNTDFKLVSAILLTAYKCNFWSLGTYDGVTGEKIIPTIPRHREELASLNDTDCDYTIEEIGQSFRNVGLIS